MPVRNAALRRALAPAVAVVLVAVLATAAGALCPRVKFVDMGYKQFSIGWTMGVDERDIPNFGGYRVWVREVWMERWTLHRSYVWGETNPEATGYWSFQPFYIDSVRVYTSAEVLNAFPYQFSVTAFKRTDPDTAAEYACRRANTTDIVYPLHGQSEDLARIRVIPNPYRSSADWEHGGERRVVFIGLPPVGPPPQLAKATIRIYTTAGTLVRTLVHDDPDSAQKSWDLKNSSGEEVAPGLYIWDVDAGELGDVEGKIIVIK